MAIYYFNFTDEIRTFTDSDGIELSNIAAVQRHATTHIRELRDAVGREKLKAWSHWKIIAVDRSRKKICEVGFDFRLHPAQ
jgi:hypothetical protein